jgi:hypothetical protein
MGCGRAALASIFGGCASRGGIVYADVGKDVSGGGVLLPELPDINGDGVMTMLWRGGSTGASYATPWD